MGCDIHIICEVKEKNIWRKNNDKVFPNPSYDKEPDFDWQKNKFNSQPNNNRWYDWFSILANVRNGYGFAGIVTGEGFKPLDYPRGVPDNACKEWKDYVDEWEGDIHSLSYLYLKDFLEYDWNQVTTKKGVIPFVEYKRLKDTGNPPDTWSGRIYGSNIVTIDEGTALGIIEEVVDEIEGQSIKDLKIYVEYYWPIIYSTWFESRIQDTVEPMKILKEKYQDVRLCFGFDN